MKKEDYEQANTLNCELQVLESDLNSIRLANEGGYKCSAIARDNNLYLSNDLEANLNKYLIAQIKKRIKEINKEIEAI